MISIIVILLTIIVCFYYLYDKCKTYAVDNYNCIWKCDLRSLIKGKYECVNRMPNISHYPWEVGEYGKTTYEECLKIQEECVEIEMKWYHDLMCESCFTLITPNY